MTRPVRQTNDFAAVLSSLQLDARTLQQPVGSTFIPHRQGDSHDDGSALESLPRLSLLGDQSATPELEIAGLLGEGGRGEVHRAQQLSLRRDVAVKSLKGGQGRAATIELLREARITGGLEHPNIVPVYALGRDAEGRVLLVMKKVGGVSWGSLLRAQRLTRTTDASRERDLEIFAQVCRAVELAHSQGVIHRDLKPDNVMVGNFGEVVVLDWGLAASLEGDPGRGLPPARDLRGLAGTPAYMAPEMVAGDGAGVGKTTDVYLLGAILHEVVAGGPPHGEGELSVVLERAFISAPPVYPPHVPTELGAICHRALHPVPEQRFPSVSALREAVRDFQRHRASALLADEAQKRLDGLPQLPAKLSPDEALTRQRALAQCRFGMEQALTGWPESPVAHAGLQRAAEAALELELVLADVRGAQQRLAELPRPVPALAERVLALQRRQQQRAAEVQQLEQLRDDLDLDGGRSQRSRNRMLAVIGVVWSAVPATLGMLQRARIFEATPAQFLASVVPFIVFISLAVFAARKSLMRNTANRRIGAALLIAAFTSAILRWIALVKGMNMTQAMPIELLTYAIVGAAVAAMVDARFLPAPVVFTLGAIACALLPQHIFFVYAASDFFALVPMALLWHRLGKPRTGFAC
jgi:hypothetical protein